MLDQKAIMCKSLSLNTQWICVFLPVFLYKSKTLQQTTSMKSVISTFGTVFHTCYEGRQNLSMVLGSNVELIMYNQPEWIYSTHYKYGKSQSLTFRGF